jgi:hypothetical protein
MKSSAHVKENPAALRRKRDYVARIRPRSVCAVRHAIARWHFAKEIGQDILAAVAKPIGRFPHFAGKSRHQIRTGGHVIT